MAMMMLLPFLAYGVYAFKGFKRGAAILLSLLILAMIVILKTRSVWVGLAGATTAIVFLIVFFGNQLSLKKQIRHLTGALFLMLFISLFAVVYFSTSHNPDSIIFKLQRIANPVDHNNIHRLQIWELTGKMIQDHPLQGVGAGNWKINSPWYYHGYNLGKDQLNWLRPHNDYLWVFAEKGIFGFIAFAGIFCLVLFYLIRLYFSPIERDKKVFTLFILGGVLSYMAVSFFTFPLERMNHQIYLALFLAATLTLYQEQFGAVPKSNAAKWLAIPVILCLGYSVVYSVSELKMETRVKQARILQERGQWQRMLELSKTIPATFRSIDSEAMPVAWYRGLAYANLQNIQQANLAYQEARKAHPTRIAVLNNLGRTYFQLGDYQSASEIFLEALTILPDYFEALVNLSSSYIQLGEYQLAYATLKKIPHNKLNDPLKGNLRFVSEKLRESGELPDSGREN
jgi:tetratricopeptide (TPR) repeat protein